MYPVIVETSFATVGTLSIADMNFPLSDIIIFGCLLTWATASPITFILSNQNGQHYMIPYQGRELIERSDYVQSHDQEFNNGGDYGGQVQGGFEPSAGQYSASNHQDYSGSFGGYDHNAQSNFEQNNHEGYDYSNHGSVNIHADNHIHSIPVSEHVEVTKPVAVPVYKEVGVPVVQPVKIHVPHPVAVGVPQPYPVAVPVSHPVPIQIIKTVAIPVEKKVPYTVEKHIPVPIEKPVPIHVERHIPVPVEKPYPIKIPVYKTIHHHAKSHHPY